MNDDWIVGKGSILDYCRSNLGLHSWDTLRRWKNSLEFPIRYLPSNKPYIVITEVRIWAIKFDDKKKKHTTC